jgi:hypothetical protein
MERAVSGRGGADRLAGNYGQKHQDEIPSAKTKTKTEKPGQGLSSHNLSVSEHCARRGGSPEEMIPSHIALSLYSENDVLYDSVRSPRYHNNPANESFRAILKSPLEQYNESSSQKTFAERIMEEWKSLDPPGRFLKQDADTKEWFEIDPKVMTRKIRKSFNDLNRVN